LDCPPPLIERKKRENLQTYPPNPSMGPPNPSTTVAATWCSPLESSRPSPDLPAGPMDPTPLLPNLSPLFLPRPRPRRHTASVSRLGRIRVTVRVPPSRLRSRCYPRLGQARAAVCTRGGEWRERGEGRGATGFLGLFGPWYFSRRSL